MKKTIFKWVVLFLFAVVSACGQSTPVPTATSLPTETPAPTETLVPTLTSTPTEVPREPTGPQAGTTLLYNDGSTLVYIPAGEFEMGGGGKNNPTHPVSVGSFWIQKTEVTNFMYSNCFGGDGCFELDENKIIKYRDDSAHWTKPVTEIKYEQAQSYCAWIGGRLPTEAEWEYVARGTGGNMYPWGNDEPTCDTANFNNCIGTVTRATNYQTDKSSFGVLGMAGNVREWVSDYFDGNYYKNSPSVNPTGPLKGNYYVVRGGGYSSPAEETRSFYRGFLKLTGSENDIGFRCIVDHPVVYAPYCASPSFTQAVQPTMPIDRCEPYITQAPNKTCNVIDGKVTGGTLVSVEPITPLSLDCEVRGTNNLFCAGSFLPFGGLSIPIKACLSCSGAATTPPPSLECPINYQKNESGTACDYTGGAFADYCPPNSTPLNENQCVYQQVQTGSCPIGSYFDEGMKACVTMGQTPRDCKDGFNYDFEQGCCQESVSVKYPLCGQDEYYSSEYGCVPLPQTDGIESCLTTPLRIRFCN